MNPRLVSALLLCSATAAGCASWTTRDKRWIPRGEWNWAVRDRLPEFFAEFNGIDFGLGRALAGPEDRKNRAIQAGVSQAF